QRAARLAAHGEGEDEEALAGELARRDRVEAPVGPAPKAGRAHARLDQAREREPARLAEPAARAAQALRLGREADERQVAVGLIAQADGAGLEGELLHERFGDLLPALPDRVATREQIEQDLDRGREAPRLQDPAADLGVVDAQARGLLALDRFALARAADALPVVVAKAHGEDETADVVQHAGREGLVRIADAEPRGEGLGRHP